jgi:uncharacterized damage-inducible protein DinB
MTPDEGWRAIVASSLDWEQGHLSLDNALKDMPVNLRARRPEGLPHSPWELVEHIRIAQHDLLRFCRDPNYHEDLKWPDDYWPRAQDTISDESWEKSLAEIRRDRDALKKLTTEPGLDLTSKIPQGTGQTYLRTVLVAVDHTAYHTGELVAIRRLLGAWPAR